jgi:hypothetical protein
MSVEKRRKKEKSVLQAFLAFFYGDEIFGSLSGSIFEDRFLNVTGMFEVVICSVMISINV